MSRSILNHPFWINITDELPEHRMPVHLKLENDEIALGCFDHISRKWCTFEKRGGNKVVQFKYIPGFSYQVD